MLKKILKIFKKSKKKEPEGEDLYYDEMNEDKEFSIKYVNKDEDIKEVKKVIKKLPIEALKEQVVKNEDKLDDFIKKSSKRKISPVPVFISLFVFLSLGINYYIVEYKNEMVSGSVKKDDELYNKVSILEQQIKDIPLVQSYNIDASSNFSEESKLLTSQINEINLKMKGFEEVSNVMTEALMKQKMELATILEKVNLITGGQDGVVLTKDDLTRIALMETNTFKNKEDIDRLLKVVEGGSRSQTNSSFNYRDQDINIQSNSIDEDKQLPLFVVYKINGNSSFYIKNRVNNKIYENAVRIKDLIVNRYEVLDIDIQNNLVIFKDHEKGVSLTLKANE